MSTPRSTNGLTLDQKLVVLGQLEQGAKHVVLAAEYGVSTSAISRIKTEADVLRERAADGVNGSRKRHRLGAWPALEMELDAYVAEVTSNGGTITGPLLRQKAIAIADDFSIDNFSASSGWLDRFKKRYGIVYKAVPSDSSDVANSNSHDPTEQSPSWSGNILNMLPQLPKPPTKRARGSWTKERSADAPVDWVTISEESPVIANSAASINGSHESSINQNLSINQIPDDIKYQMPQMSRLPTVGKMHQSLASIRQFFSRHNLDTRGIDMVEDQLLLHVSNHEAV